MRIFFAISKKFSYARALTRASTSYRTGLEAISNTSLVRYSKAFCSRSGGMIF
jgi:hypothetical protein